MDVFGYQWHNHPERIEQAWKESVASDDWVLVPGDISWAMRLQEAAEDLAFLGMLPGNIILVRGNHDYWWQGIGKVRQALPPNMYAVQNDYVLLPGGIAVCGTRGWELPSREGVSAHDIRIYEREVTRLRLSLEQGRRSGARRLIAMLHFPPAESGAMPTGFTATLAEFGVDTCVYGHLHGEATRSALKGCHRGIAYHLVAADALDFRPLFLEYL